MSLPLQKSNLKYDTVHKLIELARKFIDFGGEYQISTLGKGNINDTFLLHSHFSTFILQCINRNVFPEPEIVADNSAVVAAHVADFYEDLYSQRFCRILPAIDGQNFVTARDTTIWRAQSYIKNSAVYEKINSEHMGFQVGKCLAQFHLAVEQMENDNLHVAIPGFHHLPSYLTHFDNVLRESTLVISGTLKDLIRDVDQFRQDGDFFDKAITNGDVTSRIIHGDPKVSNILFSRETNQAISMIDLDTVGTGLLLYDIGDCLRSCSNSHGESRYKKKAFCNLPVVSSVLRGYLTTNKLSDFEIESIFSAFYLITFELGLRFLTDYMQNNHYFRVSYPEENLHRAMVQFDLVKSIAEHRSAIEKSVQEIIKTGIIQEENND